MLLAPGASALAAPAPGQAPAAGSVVLGRKNPFRPLIGVRRAEPLAASLPLAPLAPPVTLPGTAQRTRPEIAELEFKGVAYDDDEALAATRIDGKMRFLRVGDRVAGATLVSIASDRIVLRKNGRILTKRLPTP
ncbi:MAG TPA: hypothetical protein V6D00_07600 [Pantanalinema sp.]